MKRNERATKWRAILGPILLIAGVLLLASTALGQSAHPTGNAAEQQVYLTMVVAPSSDPLPPPSGGNPTWEHLSTSNGELPPPSESTEQVAALVLDVDRDGLNDFVIGARRDPGPAVVWYQRTVTGWERRVIESDAMALEAGGAFHDIDGDGDLDVVLGGNGQDNHIWWWENPYPDYAAGTDWVRRDIKDSGQNTHHDMAFGDVDGDGATELVYWNQDAKGLFVVDVPADPRQTEPWPGAYKIFSAPSNKYEGLALADMDGDGQLDIVGGGRWFKHSGGQKFAAEVVSDSEQTREVVAQIIPGGRPEVVHTPGDTSGMAHWYEWDGAKWVEHDLFEAPVDYTHTLETADINGDGHADLFIGEMRFAPDNKNYNPDAMTWVLFGDGKGKFQVTEVDKGYGHHESRLGDLNGDGRIDILGKPYEWDTPRIDIWLNNSDEAPPPPPGACNLDNWQTQVIDDARPWRAIFIDSGDLNGDGFADLITGAWWYRNPGASGQEWVRSAIGAPLNEMAAVYDFDGDGDLDILGTKHDGNANQPHTGAAFVWAQNDGAGNFTIHENIEPGNGNFLQGAAVGRFSGEGLEVMLSWHREDNGIERLTVPADPVNQTWTLDSLFPISQAEALSAGDINGDGKLDLLLGTKWLENQSPSWLAHTLYAGGGDPDRNHLVDMDGDDRLDAVVGYEAISEPGKLAWYRAPANPAGQWAEEIIATIIGPMSVDVADIDGDGDPDVVAGEHNTRNPGEGRVFLFENRDGTWQQHLVATGDEHHAGTQFVDVNNDGRLEIVSIGWNHDRVLLYQMSDCD